MKKWICYQSGMPLELEFVEKNATLIRDLFFLFLDPLHRGKDQNSYSGGRSRRWPKQNAT